MGSGAERVWDNGWSLPIFQTGFKEIGALLVWENTHRVYGQWEGKKPLCHIESMQRAVAPFVPDWLSLHAFPSFLSSPWSS